MFAIIHYWYGPDFFSFVLKVNSGATGFLGSALLATVLSVHSCDVHCLVRARDDVEGLVRLKKAVAWCPDIQESAWNRVHACRIRSLAKEYIYF